MLLSYRPSVYSRQRLNLYDMGSNGSDSLWKEVNLSPFLFLSIYAPILPPFHRFHRQLPRSFMTFCVAYWTRRQRLKQGNILSLEELPVLVRKQYDKQMHDIMVTAIKRQLMESCGSIKAKTLCVEYACLLYGLESAQRIQNVRDFCHIVEGLETFTWSTCHMYMDGIYNALIAPFVVILHLSLQIKKKTFMSQHRTLN